MPRILFIVDHRLNRSTSQRHRFEQYLPYFKEEGFEWELSEIITEKDDAIFYKSGNYVKKVFIILKSLVIRNLGLITRIVKTIRNKRISIF